MRRSDALVSEIKAGPRHRKDAGDLAPLIESIGRVGLLQPVGVNTRMELVFGGRRLEACKRIGWGSIPVVILSTLDDAASAMIAERDENTCRKEMTVSELVSLGKELEALERPKAAAREKSGRPSGNLPEGSTGDTRDKVGEALGMSGKTYEKARVVVDSGSPELVAAMDAGEVSVSAAAAIADEPAEEQAELVARGEAEIIARGKELLAKKRQAQQDERKAKRLAEMEAKAAANPAGLSDWLVITGDCVTVLGELSDRPRLIFADPPYNIAYDGYDHKGDGGKSDELTPDQYLAWVEEWVSASARAVTADGSFWLLISDEFAAEACLIVKRFFTLRSWVIWYETFGVNCADKFNRTKRHLFYAVRDPRRFVFHADAVSRPSDRQLKYADPRANPDGKIFDDVWLDIPRLVGTAAERIPDFPTQLPLSLLRRVVGCCTDPGDLVFDPFTGSGTTGAAALGLGRRFVGSELRQRFASLASLRLKGVSRETE